MTRTNQRTPRPRRGPSPRGEAGTPCQVRLTSDERTRFEAAARTAGVSLSAWMRQACEVAWSIEFRKTYP